MRTKILKVLTYIAGILYVLFATAVDSGSIIPIIVCLICGTWMVLICIANTPKGDHYGSRKNF